MFGRPPLKSLLRRSTRTEIRASISLKWREAKERHHQYSLVARKPAFETPNSRKLLLSESEDGKSTMSCLETFSGYCPDIEINSRCVAKTAVAVLVMLAWLAYQSLAYFRPSLLAFGMSSHTLRR